MRRHPLFYPYLALISVCFFWGTTYVAIRMALESLPPLFIVCVRFILSGGIMLIAARRLNAHLPRGRELWRTAFFGIMVLGIGNGCLVFAEMYIPSGMAALFITTSPFWLVGMEALMPGGERMHLPVLGGMMVGLAGVVLLVARGVQAPGGAHLLTGFLILQAGCFAWTLGSLLQRREPTRAHPVVSGAVQQLAAGLAYAIPAVLWDAHGPVFTWRSTGALLYLVLFGSIVGYSAFIYAMDRLPVSIVSIYTYINPVVAVALGWLFYREPFGGREALAVIVIFAGVALVKRYSPRQAVK